MATKFETIKTYGALRLDGDKLLKVRLVRYNGKYGVVVNTWFKPSEEYIEERKPELDAHGYAPGKGLTLPLMAFKWLISKGDKVLNDDAFQSALEESKAEPSKAAKVDTKAALEALGIDEETLKLLNELKAAKSGKKAGKKAEDAAEELEVEVAESVAVPTQGKGRRKARS